MKPTSTLRNACLAAGLAGGVLNASPAAAVEGGVFGGPVGGTDIRQAYLPPVPGLYGAAFFLASKADSYQDQNGNSTLNTQSVSGIGNPASFTGLVGGGALLYVYPINPLGFTVASSFQVNYQGLSQALSINPHAPVSYLHGDTTGFGDSYADIFYASRYLGLFGAQPGNNPKLKYGLTVAFGYAAEIPLGTYNSANFVNAGKNTFISIPNVALTYLTGPNLSFGDGTEISARLFYEGVFRNPATGYEGGNLYDLDFAVTQRWSNFQVGIAGSYALQTTADYNSAGKIVAPFGNYFEKLILGPVIAYDWLEQNMTFKLKATWGVHNQNTYLNNTIAFSVAKKLW